MSACPDFGTLFAGMAGELPPREQREFDAHLAACDACRRERDEIIVELNVQSGLDGAIARPGQPASELQARLERGFQQRLHQFKQDQIHEPRRLAIRPWMGIAALVPLIVSVVITMQLSQTVVRAADAVLSRAAEADAAQPAALAQRIRLRLTRPGTALPTREQTFEWTFDTAPDPSVALATPSASLTHALDSVLPFDWHTPLAVARFYAWRAGLPDKHDTVTILDRFVIVRTTTTAPGAIVEGELAIARDTFHVVRLSWVVAGLGRLDIEEVGAWLRPENPAPLRAAAGLDREALDRAARTDLAARVALRATDLDLVPITVRQSATGDIQVEGFVPSSAAYRALTARLAPVPHVSLALRVGAAPECPRVVARRLLHAIGELHERHESDLDADRASLVPDIVRRTPRIAQRLAALETLADRYPAEIVAALPIDAQATWRGLIDAHFRGLRSDLTALDDQLATFIGSAGRPILPVRPPKDWRVRTPRALAEARALAALLTPLASPDRSPSPTEVRGHLNALWGHLDPERP